MEKATMSMTLSIDIIKKRVMYAEVGEECMNFLFRLLSLPLDTLHRVKDTPASWPDVYRSLLNKDADSESESVDDKQQQFFRCSNSCYGFSYVSDDPTAVCPSCGHKMSTTLLYVAPPPPPPPPAEEVEEVESDRWYVVCDDLGVIPKATISTLLLSKKYEPSFYSEEVNFGMDEAYKLLMASSQTAKVLTSVFYHV